MLAKALVNRSEIQLIFWTGCSIKFETIYAHRNLQLVISDQESQLEIQIEFVSFKNLRTKILDIDNVEHYIWVK
jgi:hypothetical protein